MVVCQLAFAIFHSSILVLCFGFFSENVSVAQKEYDNRDEERNSKRCDLWDHSNENLNRGFRVRQIVICDSRVDAQLAALREARIASNQSAIANS